MSLAYVYHKKIIKSIQADKNWNQTVTWIDTWKWEALEMVNMENIKDYFSILISFLKNPQACLNQ